MASKDKDIIIEDELYDGYFNARIRALEAEGLTPQENRQKLADLLRETRVSKGLSLEEVAEITRVRVTYLEAIEQAAYDVLPSRAFAIGYIKAFARALDLDEESLADLYKRESDEGHIKLQAPMGASLEDLKPTRRGYVIAAILIVSMIVMWNIFQRKPDINLEFARKIDQDDRFLTSQNNLIHKGLIFVAKPSPPPPDQDIPAPYFTPGLEAGFALIEAEKNANKTVLLVDEAFQRRKGFNAQGVVYGALPSNSSVIIQAKRPVNLVLRTADGLVHFSQNLAPGGAYRIPKRDQQDLIVDVSDYRAIEVFHNGEFAGGLDSDEMTVGRINVRASEQARALDQVYYNRPVAVSSPQTEIEAPSLPTATEDPIPYVPTETTPTGQETVQGSPTEVEVVGPQP